MNERAASVEVVVGLLGLAAMACAVEEMRITKDLGLLRQDILFNNMV